MDGGIGNGREGGIGQDKAGAKSRGARGGGLGPVHDLDLDGLARDARIPHGGTDAAHQILAAARGPIVPNPLPGRREQVARGKLREVIAVTRRGYTISITNESDFILDHSL